LSEALDVKPDYFFARNQIDIDSINFRKKATLGKKAVESIKAHIKDTIERYSELESYFPISQSFENPLAGREISCLDDIRRAAMELREAWGYGAEEPIAYVIKTLENHSIRVIQLEEGDGFDGLSGWVEMLPFIVLNSNIPSDRKRLTSLHEFAHLTLKFSDSLSDSEREKLCHAFGGMFLLPGTALKKELGEKRLEVSFFELDRLKRQYGISMQAIMYRARQEGVISEYVHESFSREMSARRWRKQEPNSYPIDERPVRFEQLLHRAISEELISVSKAAYLASTSIEDIRSQRTLENDTSHS
jgi:Zn-dependent peptidase ImmA (M78 family)